MEFIVPALVIFIATVVVLELLLWARRAFRDPDRRRVKKRLKGVSTGGFSFEAPDIIRKKILSDIPALNEILLHTPGIQHLDRLLYLANVRYHLGFFFLLSIVLALFGYIITARLTHNQLLAVILMVVLGASPYYYLRRKKRKRMYRFEEQLPEGLELIGRSLKAGHAFSAGLDLAAKEFGDPLGTEFKICIDEINFGVSVQDALRNLAERVECGDLKFFVVAVILQRETGGNLSEIIESIAHLIRERFKLQDKIRVLSAEGRLSMYVLSGLPFVMVLYIAVVNPTYIGVLMTHLAGKIMIGLAVFLMVMGIYVMKRMIDIEV